MRINDVLIRSRVDGIVNDPLQLFTIISTLVSLALMHSVLLVLALLIGFAALNYDGKETGSPFSLSNILSPFALSALVIGFAIGISLPSYSAVTGIAALFIIAPNTTLLVSLLCKQHTEKKVAEAMAKVKKQEIDTINGILIDYLAPGDNAHWDLYASIWGKITNERGRTLRAHAIETLKDIVRERTGSQDPLLKMYLDKVQWGTVTDKIMRTYDTGWK